MLNSRYKSQGKARPSFLKELIENPEVCSDTEKLDIVKWSAASLYAGASDTVSRYRSYTLRCIVTQSPPDGLHVDIFLPCYECIPRGASSSTG
jgi:hypothetical protein